MAQPRVCGKGDFDGENGRLFVGFDFCGALADKTFDALRPWRVTSAAGMGGVGPHPRARVL